MLAEALAACMLCVGVAIASDGTRQRVLKIVSW